MTHHVPAATPPPSAALALFGLAAALTLAACSGKNVKPGVSLAEAETAVARAERARIGDYDPTSWKAARENLVQARAAAVNEPADGAGRWFAARAKADAELGLVRAERARLSALTASLKREILVLAPPAAPAAPATPAVPTVIEAPAAEATP
jgi:hypothetical protein